MNPSLFACNINEDPTKLANIRSNNVSTEHLREKLRNYASELRDKKRVAITDALRFGLAEINKEIQDLDHLQIADVQGLAMRIKRRKHATAQDLYRLSFAFVQNIENIIAFAKIPGALQVVIKELIGHQRRKLAAACVCNLSLGDAKTCDKITTHAGSYLVTYLDSGDPYLKRYCLWILQNIVSSGGKAVGMILQMKLIEKLWPLYISEETNAEGYQEDAAICLLNLCKVASSTISNADIIYIKEHMMEKQPHSIASEYHMGILWELELIKMELTDTQLNYILNFALNCISMTKDLTTTANIWRIFYGLRCLANVVALTPRGYEMLEHELLNSVSTNLISLLNKLFGMRNKSLTSDTFWLLKNIIEQQEEPEIALTEIVKHLIVYDL